MTNPEGTIAAIKRKMGTDYKGEHRPARSTPPADSRVHTAEDQEGRRGIPGRHRDQGGNHGPGIFQRQPARTATKDAGAIAGLEVDDDHQRADGRRTGIRPGQAEHVAEDHGLRPGRRYPRRNHHGLPERRVRGGIDLRRHPARAAPTWTRYR